MPDAFARCYFICCRLPLRLFSRRYFFVYYAFTFSSFDAAAAFFAMPMPFALIIDALRCRHATQQSSYRQYATEEDLPFSRHAADVCRQP